MKRFKLTLIRILELLSIVPKDWMSILIPIRERNLSQCLDDWRGNSKGTLEYHWIIYETILHINPVWLSLTEACHLLIDILYGTSGQINQGEGVHENQLRRSAKLTLLSERNPPLQGFFSHLAEFAGIKIALAHKRVEDMREGNANASSVSGLAI